MRRVRLGGTGNAPVEEDPRSPAFGLVPAEGAQDERVRVLARRQLCERQLLPVFHAKGEGSPSTPPHRAG